MWADRILKAVIVDLELCRGAYSLSKLSQLCYYICIMLRTDQYVLFQAAIRYLIPGFEVLSRSV